MAKTLRTFQATPVNLVSIRAGRILTYLTRVHSYPPTSAQQQVLMVLPHNSALVSCVLGKAWLPAWLKGLMTIASPVALAGSLSLVSQESPPRESLALTPLPSSCFWQRLKTIYKEAIFVNSKMVLP